MEGFGVTTCQPSQTKEILISLQIDPWLTKYRSQVRASAKLMRSKGEACLLSREERIQAGEEGPPDILSSIVKMRGIGASIL